MFPGIFENIQSIWSFLLSQEQYSLGFPLTSGHVCLKLYILSYFEILIYFLLQLLLFI